MTQDSDTKCEVLEWDAWLDTMPPGPASVHVSGKAQCPSAGYALRVVRQVPQGINPRDLLLPLEELAPKVSGQVVSQVEFSYSVPAKVGQFDTVTLLPLGTKKVRTVS